jgi:hypothetical protein
MLSLALSSPPAQVTYCRVHQRAWVASLDRWVTFRVPTRDGSPITDAPCDLCTATHHSSEAVAGHRRWSTLHHVDMPALRLAPTLVLTEERVAPLLALPYDTAACQ